jgi:multidrug transporter EmrE-like cation transporter
MNLLVIIPAIVWLILSGIFNAFGEYLSKEWGYTHTWELALFVAVAYVCSSLLWLPALLKQNQLSTMGVAWILIALVFTLILGLVVFKEHLSLIQWVGIVLGSIAVVLLLA